MKRVLAERRELVHKFQQIEVVEDAVRDLYIQMKVQGAGIWKGGREQLYSRLGWSMQCELSECETPAGGEGGRDPLYIQKKPLLFTRPELRPPALPRTGQQMGAHPHRSSCKPRRQLSSQRTCWWSWDLCTPCSRDCG